MKFKQGQKVRLKSSVNKASLFLISISDSKFLQKGHTEIVQDYREKNTLYFKDLSDTEVNTEEGWVFPEYYLESAEESIPRSHPLTNIFK